MLGRAVTDAAVEAGHDVVALDLPGRHAPDGEESLRTIDVDLTDYPALQAGLAGCDAVIHLAAYVKPTAAPEPQVHHNNVIASYNTLLAAADNGITKVCLVSSINAIGGAYSHTPHYDWFPVTEDHPTYSHDPYSLSKWIAEAQAADFARRDPRSTIVCLRVHALLRDAAQLASWKNNLPPAATKDLWGYTALDDATAACLASVQADFTGSAVIYVVAPTTSTTRPTQELRQQYYPDVEVRGDLSGHRGFFNCDKSARLLGLTPTSLELEASGP